MSNIDLHPVRNNPDLPDFFKQHILKRIEEQNGQYGLAWRLIRRYREGKYCLANKAGGKLCLNNAKIPGDGPRGRCGWHGGTGNSGPKTAEGRKRIGDAQRLRWARYRVAKGIPCTNGGNRIEINYEPGIWWPDEPVKEMTMFSKNYDLVISLLVLSDAPPHKEDLEESEDLDTYDKFTGADEQSAPLRR